MNRLLDFFDCGTSDWLIALIAVIAVCCALPSLFAHTDAKREVQRLRANLIAQQACPREATPVWMDDKTIQCLMTNGRRSGRPVKVASK